MPRNSQTGQAKLSIVSAAPKADKMGQDKKQPITYQGILDKTLLGLSEGVDTLREIVNSADSDNKEKIAAVNCMMQVSIKLMEAQVASEHLPLLQALEKNVKAN